MNRRTLLSACASTGAIAIAGCLADGEGSPDDGDGDAGDPAGDGDADDGDGPTPASGVGDASIETTAAGCAGSDDDWIEADLGGPVVVRGRLPAPDPCHEAVLEAVDVADGTLSLTVDVRDATGEDESCAQCLGAIEYEARVHLEAGTTVERLAVDHVTGDAHEHPACADGQDEPADQDATASVADAGIETTDSECGGAEVDDVDARREAETIVVDGSRTAPNPCHRATLESATIDGSRLSVTVDVEPVDEDEMCIECVGRIEYEIQAEVTAASAVDAVRVDHVGGDVVDVELEDPDGTAC